MVPDIYAWFGVPPDAHIDEIKASWKSLAKRWHPDLNPGSALAENNFRALNEAYQVLSDPARRAQYDLARRPPPPRLPAWGWIFSSTSTTTTSSTDTNFTIIINNGPAR